MPNSPGRYEIREACLPQDAAGIAAIDTGFSSDRYWRVEHVGESFRLELVPRRRFEKAFSVYDLDASRREWEDAEVAEQSGQIVGFAAGGYQPWNRRYVLWHIYVAPACRGSGVGTALLMRVLTRAQLRQAASVWLETSNFNAPAIAWYRRHGFDFAGLDLALYDGTGIGDEVGVYLMRRLAPA